MKDFTDKNISYIYPLIFYIAGILCSTLLFRGLSMIKYTNALSKVFAFDTSSLFNIFLDRLIIYLLVYVISILVGLCVIGFPVINTLPLCIGFIIGIKICYYYCSYKMKGISFSVLMIIPETSFVLVVLINTIKTARELSKDIYDRALQNKSNEIDRAGYLKSFLYYLLLIIIISAVNSLLIYVFNFVIKI